MEYITNLPNISLLLCINAEGASTSTYNSNIRKCRQLLFENKDIIAYPEVDNKVEPNRFYIVIVVKEIFYTARNLEQILRNNNLQITGPPKAVSKDAYEKCCRYTISTKIAPQWNTIVDFFVKGEDFLTNSSPLDFTDLTIRITEEGNTTFIFRAGRVELPKMSEESLSLGTSVRVLPKLTEAIILESWPNNEHTLSSQEYWRNTYGYNLPELDSEVTYLKVQFFDKRNSTKTYPLICVLPDEPNKNDLNNIDEIVNKFMVDMRNAVPILLGEKPVFELLSGNEDENH